LLYSCFHAIVLKKEFSVVGICGLFVLTGVQSCPYFFDIIMAKNETHAYYLIPLLSKYYIMEEKHFYILIVYCVLILHMNLTCVVGTFVLVSTGTMMLSYLIFTCGMFKIARYEFFIFYIYKIIHIIITIAEMLFTVTILNRQ